MCLLPCPFCRGGGNIGDVIAVEVESPSKKTHYRIICERCEHEGDISDNIEGAISAWNTGSARLLSKNAFNLMVPWWHNEKLPKREQAIVRAFIFENGKPRAPFFGAVRIDVIEYHIPPQDITRSEWYWCMKGAYEPDITQSKGIKDIIIPAMSGIVFRDMSQITDVSIMARYGGTERFEIHVEPVTVGLQQFAKNTL